MAIRQSRYSGVTETVPDPDAADIHPDLQWKMLKRDLDGNMVSQADYSAWTVGQWRYVDGGLALCGWGFHASRDPLSALGYVNPHYVTQVQVAGPGGEEDNSSANHKQVWSYMRVVRAWVWEKQDSVQLAYDVAKEVVQSLPADTVYLDTINTALAAVAAWLADPNQDNEYAVMPWEDKLGGEADFNSVDEEHRYATRAALNTVRYVCAVVSDDSHSNAYEECTSYALDYWQESMSDYDTVLAKRTQYAKAIADHFAHKAPQYFVPGSDSTGSLSPEVTQEGGGGENVPR